MLAFWYIQKEGSGKNGLFLGVRNLVTVSGKNTFFSEFRPLKKINTLFLDNISQLVTS